MVNLGHSRQHWCIILAFVAAALFEMPRANAQPVERSPESHEFPLWTAHASPRPVVVTRSNGKVYNLFFDGDGESHWYSDENEFTVVMNDGDYYFARLDAASGELVATDFRLGDVDPTKVGLKPRLYPTKRFVHALAPPNPGERPYKPRGKIKMMVVLMRFANHAERDLPEPQVLNEIFNREGGHEKLAPGGSLRDFILKNSYGQLDLVSSVLPTWIPLPKKEKYYADGASGIGKERRLNEAFHFCLDWIENNIQVDLSDFDSNDDGFIDAIAFVHSGYSAGSGDFDPDGAEPQDRIWSHQSRMKPWMSKKGLATAYYLALPAFHDTQEKGPVRVGLISHEVAHLTRLLDLYDPRHRSSGVGAWSVLGFHWGFDQSGHYPSHLGPWEKIKLGWVKPIEITEPGEFRIRNVEQNRDVYRISVGFPEGEYLLIENRQPVGFHRHLPIGQSGRGGLAVWHIDENKEDNSEPGFPEQTGWPLNGSHFRVAMVQADGKFDLERRRNHAGDGDDLFRAGHLAEIGPEFYSKRPLNTDPYLHKPSQGFLISNISASSSEMTFRVNIVRQDEQAVRANANANPSSVLPLRLDPNMPPLRVGSLQFPPSSPAVRAVTPHIHTEAATTSEAGATSRNALSTSYADAISAVNSVPITAWKRLPNGRRF